MTIGEDRVRTKFNPSANGLVDQIKQKSAELIDMCNEPNRIEAPPMTGETIRLWKLAQTAYEEAAMWAVKAATACLLACLLVFSPAHAADLKLPAAPAPAPACTQAGCSGFYAYAGIGGQGSKVDILGSGLGGSVFSNGAEMVGGVGYQLWNGQFFAAFEAGGGWLIPAAGQAVSLSSRWEGETLLKLGIGLQGLFGPTPANPSVFQQLAGNVISPYAIIGGRYRSFGSGLATGAGLQYYLGSNWTIDAQYIHVNYEGAVDNSGAAVHTDNSVRLVFARHF